jgi:hypothetical protein
MHPPSAQDHRHEGIVYKETDGVWKERYLVLQPDRLVVSLPPGNQPSGTVSLPGNSQVGPIALPNDRSRAAHVALSSISSVVIMDELHSGHFRYPFAIHGQLGFNVLLAVTSAQERDVWIGKLHSALGMS